MSFGVYIGSRNLELHLQIASTRRKFGVGTPNFRSNVWLGVSALFGFLIQKGNYDENV